MLWDVHFDQHVNHPLDEIVDNIRINTETPRPTIGWKTAALIGGGPSLTEYTEELLAFQGDFFALNGSAKYLHNLGITPKFHVIMDARPENISFLEYPDIHTTYLLASQCHPSLFDRLEGYKVVIWHAAAGEPLDKVFTPGSQLIGSGPTVGLRAMNIAYILGYRYLSLYGYDSCAYHAYPQAMNAGQKMHTFNFNSKDYEASGPMGSQAEAFINDAAKLIQLDVNISVRSKGLLPAMWEKHLEIQQGTLEQRERYKYCRLWRMPEYRTFPSPSVMEKVAK
jgi:uncharacterized Rossmann fold enzyme